MRILAALLAAALPALATAEPATKVDMAYFYDVAVFEVSMPGDYKPDFTNFGKARGNPDDLHTRVGDTRIDSGQYRDFNILALVDNLRQTAPPRLVANVAIPKGDTLRFPCGIGSNVDLDFKNAADADEKPATVVAHYLAMKINDREVADMGLGLIGDMATAGDAQIRFVAHSGETVAVSMLRPGPEGRQEGCILLMRP